MKLTPSELEYLRDKKYIIAMVKVDENEIVTDSGWKCMVCEVWSDDGLGHHPFCHIRSLLPGALPF